MNRLIKVRLCRLGRRLWGYPGWAKTALGMPELCQCGNFPLTLLMQISANRTVAAQDQLGTAQETPALRLDQMARE